VTFYSSAYGIPVKVITKDICLHLCRYFASPGQLSRLFRYRRDKNAPHSRSIGPGFAGRGRFLGQTHQLRWQGWMTTNLYGLSRLHHHHRHLFAPIMHMLWTLIMTSEQDNKAQQHT